MTAFEGTRKQQIIITTATYGVIVAIVVFFGALFMQTSALGQTKAASVSIGPLRLMELTKSPLPTGGAQANLQFLPGLLAYFVAATLLSIALGVARARYTKLN